MGIKRNYTSLKNRQAVKHFTKLHLYKESSGPPKVPTPFRDNNKTSNKTSISKVQPENSYPEIAPLFLF